MGGIRIVGGILSLIGGILVLIVVILTYFGNHHALVIQAYIMLLEFAPLMGVWNLIGAALAISGGILGIFSKKVGGLLALIPAIMWTVIGITMLIFIDPPMGTVYYNFTPMSFLAVLLYSSTTTDLLLIFSFEAIIVLVGATLILGGKDGDFTY